MPDLLNVGRLAKCYFTGDKIKVTVRVKIPEKEEKRIKDVEVSFRVQEQTKMRPTNSPRLFEHKKTSKCFKGFIAVILILFS